MTVHPDLEALVRSIGRSVTSVTEMPGGASTRRYFRVFLAAPPSLIAMFVPEGGKPEEIAKDRASARRWPFLEIRELLAERGVDVPALHAEDPERGWLLLEDLGDDTLANYLVRVGNDSATREELYRRAVVDLATAQKALGSLPAGCVIGARAFDADLLRWEIDHFREWGLEARGHELSASARATFDAVAARLASRIASWPRGFVHRDYQSRNLMVRTTKSLCWLDFQDALLGPRVYDLVALLNDSYQTFDRAFVEARVGEYARTAGVTDVDTLLLEFDYVTVQRKLKDAGRFVFIDRKKGNDSFLKFVTPTIRKAAESLTRLRHDEDMRTLEELLHTVLGAEI